MTELPDVGPEYERDSHLWQWRGGRTVHLAGCPCWRDETPAPAQIRARWSTVIPGDATVPPGDRLFRRRRWWSL
jgi:hypothetical protein